MSERQHKPTRSISAVEGDILERAFERCAGPKAGRCAKCKYNGVSKDCERLIDKLIDRQFD